MDKYYFHPKDASHKMKHIILITNDIDMKFSKCTQFIYFVIIRINKIVIIATFA